MEKHAEPFCRVWWLLMAVRNALIKPPPSWASTSISEHLHGCFLFLFYCHPDSVPLFYASHPLLCFPTWLISLSKGTVFLRMYQDDFTVGVSWLWTAVKEHSASYPTSFYIFFQKSIEVFLLELENVLHCFSIPPCPNIVPATLHWSELVSWSPGKRQILKCITVWM